MELLIAILMYLGMMSPEAVASASSNDLNCMISSNREVIEHILLDQTAVHAAGDLIIDRRED